MAMYPRDRASSSGRVDHYPYTVFHRAFKANQTGSAIAFDVPTTTQPVIAANNGIHELQKGTKLLVIPYGTDTNGDEFRMGIQLWHPLYDRISAIKDSEDVAWVGTVGALVDCTMDAVSVPAAAVGPLTTDDLFCDIIAKVAGTTQPLVSVNDIVPTGGDVPTKMVDMFTVETNGAKYVKFYIDIDGGAGTPAASGNALFAVI
jgi:hypothetical protein